MNSIVWRSKGAELLIKSPRPVNEETILYGMCQLRKKQKKVRKKAAKIYERTTKNGTELMVLQVGRSLEKSSWVKKKGKN